MSEPIGLKWASTIEHPYTAVPMLKRGIVEPAAGGPRQSSQAHQEADVRSDELRSAPAASAPHGLNQAALTSMQVDLSPITESAGVPLSCEQVQSKMRKSCCAMAMLAKVGIGASRRNTLCFSPFLGSAISVAGEELTRVRATPPAARARHPCDVTGVICNIYSLSRSKGAILVKDQWSRHGFTLWRYNDCSCCACPRSRPVWLSSTGGTTR